MRIANIVISIVLILFAAVQVNDPDALVWGVIYLVGALWPGLAAWRPDEFGRSPILRIAAWGSLLAFLVGFAWLAPSIDRNWIHVEEARESLGYAICAAATALALWSVARRPGTAASRARPAPATRS